MVDVYDEDKDYVCITHQSFIPCDKGDHHLISNWKTDVNKIRQILESREKK